MRRRGKGEIKEDKIERCTRRSQTRDRVQGRETDEFMKVMNSIVDEDK